MRSTVSFISYSLSEACLSLKSNALTLSEIISEVNFGASVKTVLSHSEIEPIISNTSTISYPYPPNRESTYDTSRHDSRTDRSTSLKKPSLNNLVFALIAGTLLLSVVLIALFCCVYIFRRLLLTFWWIFKSQSLRRFFTVCVAYGRYERRKKCTSNIPRIHPIPFH